MSSISSVNNTSSVATSSTRTSSPALYQSASIDSNATRSLVKSAESNVTVVNKNPPSADELKALVHEGNTLFQKAGSNLQFQIDDATKQVVVKVVDSKTGEVVRQIPTVEMLDFIRAMKEQEGNMGKLFQTKA